MSVSTSPKVTVGPGVPEFLRKHDAEGALPTICEIIRECFPQAVAIETLLEEDYDEPGWWQVVVVITLPASVSTDVCHEQHKRYHELRSERIPHAQNSLFVTIRKYQPE